MTEAQSFWDRNPCEAWHSSSEIGTRQWCNDITIWRYCVQPHIVAFADFSAWCGKRVMEFGCGIGTDALQFARHGATVHAVDSSFESIRIALSRPRSGNVAFMWRDRPENIETPDPPYDLIYSFGVLHHMEDPLGALKVFRKLIAPTGELRIMVYARWSLKFLTRQRPEAAEGCPIVRLHTAKSITRLLGEAGFRPIEMRKAHIFPWSIPAYRAGILKRRWPYRYLSRGAMNFLDRHLGHHLLVRAVPG